MGFLKTFTHPLVAGPIAGCIVILLAYLDAKYRDIEKDNSTYIKLFIVSSLVFATLVYFISEEYDQTDEFLNQNYDTSVPSLLPKKKILGGTQPTMKRPKTSVSLMDNLPEPGTFQTPSNISLTMKPKYR